VTDADVVFFVASFLACLLTRAFHMGPSALKVLNLQFDDDDGASTSSDFGFDVWKVAFKPLHPPLREKMYFL